MKSLILSAVIVLGGLTVNADAHDNFVRKSVDRVATVGYNTVERVVGVPARVVQRVRVNQPVRKRLVWVVNRQPVRQTLRTVLCR